MLVLVLLWLCCRGWDWLGLGACWKRAKGGDVELPWAPPVPQPYSTRSSLDSKATELSCTRTSPADTRSNKEERFSRSIPLGSRRRRGRIARTAVALLHLRVSHEVSVVERKLTPLLPPISDSPRSASRQCHHRLPPYRNPARHHRAHLQRLQSLRLDRTAGVRVRSLSCRPALANEGAKSAF